MFGMQGNSWIWILLAYFLLSGNSGCGCGFDLKGLNIFGCGQNSWLIIAIIAFFLLQSGSLSC